MNPSAVNDSSQYAPHKKGSFRGEGGDKILVGKLVKAKVGDLEDEVREVFLK